MKSKALRSLFAGIAVLAILISCVLTGLVLPAAAADVTYSNPQLQLPNVWIMTGRYRIMGKSTATSSSGGTTSIAAADMTWEIADTGIATIDTSGRITPVKVGTTTLTGTFPSDIVDTSGNVLSKTIALNVVDGSKYVYFDPEYELGANIVPNGDFENGSTDWVVNKNPDAIEDPAAIDFTATGGKDGTAGLQFKSGVSWRSGLLANATVKPGNTYLFSFDYLAAPGNTFQVYGGNLDIPTTTFTQGTTADGEWHTYTCLLKMPIITSGNRYLYFNVTTVNESNPVVIDNVSICEYTSLEETDSLLLNYSEKRLAVGQAWRLEAVTEPYGGDLNGITWTSDNEEVATVAAANGRSPSNVARNAYAEVTAVGAGTATIKATTADGMIASCEITVSSSHGEGLLLDPACDNADSKAWKAPYGAVVKYDAAGGQDASSALVVSRNYPVSQQFTGLLPNTTYTLQGAAKPAADSHLVVTVKNGDQVLATLNEQYSGEWNTVVTESATAGSQLNAGFRFTTPEALESDTTVIHIAVLKSSTDTADTLVSSGSYTASTGKVEQGEGEITDNDDDLSTESVYVAYIDSIDIFEASVDNVDLTPTYVQWTGDSDNDGQITPGTQVTFQVPVKNVGSEDLPAGEAFDIEIAANREVIRTFTYSGGIAAGETVLIADTEAWTAVEGDYMISARVNANLDIAETNITTNQTYQLNLRVADDVYAPAYNADVVAQAGMDRLTMSDDFNDLSSVDTLAGGAEGYKWYVTRPWGGTPLTPYDYSVSDGVLTLMSENPAYGIAFNSVDMATNNGFRYKQGYLEVRLRVVRPSPNDSHESGIPTVWSFTQDKAMENIYGADTHWVELDWLEYWGNTNQYDGGYYTTTFHQSTTVEADPSYSNSNHSLEGLGDAEWHVMGWLWEENSIRTFLDGVEMMNMLVDDEASLVPGARVNKTDADGNKIGASDDIGLFSWMNEEAAVLYLGGSKDNPHEIDYVRIWQTSEPETVSDNMTLDKTELTMSEDTRERLTVTVPEGEDAGTITWESSDPTVATVHGNGEVYARAAGAAVITATNANGLSVMCDVTVQHNVISNGDFEFTANEDLLYKHWTSGVLAKSAANIVADPDGSDNQVLAITTTSSTLRYNNAAVKRGKTYLLTGKYKGPDTMRVYVGYGNGVVAHKVSGSEYTANSWHDISGTATSDGWKIFEIQFTTAAEGETIAKGWNNNYIVPTFSNNQAETLYLDDIVLTEVDDVYKDSYTLTVGEMTNGSVTLAANGSTISSGAALTPGTYVDVTVAPGSGYQLTHGSLAYSYALPTINGDRAVTRRVLNKNSGTFGEDTGNTFRFVMPAEDVTLNALFEQTATATDSIVATLGTSVYITNDTEISGVRFLNRLYYSRMDADTGKLYVTYNGTEQEVTQFGSLLKRATNDGELTLAAYDEHKSDSGATRIWKSESMKNGNLYLVDYTNGYVDFTITMTSSVANRYAFLDRGYTVCGYVTLADGTTIYTEAFTDSVLDARTRSL